MNVKEAVARAKAYLLDVFSDEKITDIRLEEVELDDLADTWCITLGLIRHSESKVPFDSAFGSSLGALRQAREYKIVHVSNKTGEAFSIKNRETTS